MIAHCRLGNELEIGDPSSGFGMLGGIEREMIEVDQQSGEVVDGGPGVFKRCDHAGASGLINHLIDTGSGMGKLSKRGKLIPAIIRKFKITIQD